MCLSIPLVCLVVVVVPPVLDSEGCDRSNGGCADRCETLDVGFVCSCSHVGYRLANDGASCVDRDECELNLDVCSQVSQFCVNTVGSYFCLDKNMANSGTVQTVFSGTDTAMFYGFSCLWVKYILIRFSCLFSIFISDSIPYCICGTFFLTTMHMHQTASAMV